MVLTGGKNEARTLARRSFDLNPHFRTAFRDLKPYIFNN